MKPGYKGDPEDFQQIFNFVYKFLLEQGRPSIAKCVDVIDGIQCMYRSPTKDCCAAGCLITDEEYDDGNIGQSEGITANGIDLFLTKCANSVFLSNLQGAHDEAFTESKQYGKPWLEIWKENMKALAEKYKLTIPEVPNGC